MSELKFRPLRRADRGISYEAAEKILHENETGFLGVTGDNGYPYVVALDYYYDAPSKAIYFHSAVEGHKLDAIKADNRVCFKVVGEATVLPDALSIAFDSAVVFGKAHFLLGSEKRRALQKLFDKYILDKGSITAEEGIAYIEEHIAQTAVVRIDVEHLSGKKRDD